MSSKLLKVIILSAVAILLAACAPTPIRDIDNAPINVSSANYDLSDVTNAIKRAGIGQADFWIAWAAGYPIRDTQCGYRLYPAALLERLAVQNGRRNRFVFESEVLIEAACYGCYARAISIDTIYGRSPRESHYRATSDTMLIIRMVAGKLARRGLYPLGLLRSLGLLPHPGIARSEGAAKKPDAFG